MNKTQETRINEAQVGDIETLRDIVNNLHDQAGDAFMELLIGSIKASVQQEGSTSAAKMAMEGSQESGKMTAYANVAKMLETYLAGKGIKEPEEA